MKNEFRAGTPYVRFMAEGRKLGVKEHYDDLLDANTGSTAPLSRAWPYGH